MYINKILSTSVDITDPNEIYQNNIDAVIIRILNKRFKRKCYASILILEILRIIKRSSIRMVDNRLDGSAYVDVQFEVKGVIFACDELLHGCKVIEIKSDMIITEHQYAIILLQKEPGGHISKILQIGQIIPVIVQKVRYIPNQNKATIAGIPYVPISKQDVYYNITSGLSVEQSDKLTIILDKIDEEEKLHEPIKKEKAYSFFRDLMYPYKTNQKFNKSNKIINNEFVQVPFQLDKMLLIDSGTIITSDKEPRYAKYFYHTKNILEDSTIQINAYTVLADILMRYLLYMIGLREFVETYPTIEQIQDLTAYWKLCKNAQM